MDANTRMLEHAKKMQEGAMAMAEMLPSILEDFVKNMSKQDAESFAAAMKDINNIKAANDKLNDLLKAK